MKFYVNNLCIEIRYSFLLIIAFSMLFKGYDYLYVLLFSVFHELGHLAALYLCKGRADKIVLSYCGFGLKHSARLSALKDLIFLSAGIMVNLIFVVFGIKKEINLALFIVNALPVYPLDGGRILKLLLNSVFNLKLSDMVFKSVSVIIIVLLLVLSAYIGSVSLALITVYIIVYSLNYNID